MAMITFAGENTKTIQYKQTIGKDLFKHQPNNPSIHKLWKQWKTKKLCPLYFQNLGNINILAG